MDKIIRLVLAVVFLVVAVQPFPVKAEELFLPNPNQFVPLSQKHEPVMLEGIKIDKENPFKIEFITNAQDLESVDEEEMLRLVSYFLASLTLPEDSLWVNLSPYEQDRIIPEKLEITEMGKSMLAQDYLLKQLSSSLTFPETEIGREYWKELDENDMNSASKIWIVPDKAQVYEKGNTAMINHARLKVLTENDYLALEKNSQSLDAGDALKDKILPQIEHDLNHGSNFIHLRQIYNSFVLAKWFKMKLKDSIYKYYINQQKIAGIDIDNKNLKENVYSRYIESFNKGLYTYTKKEADKTKKRYFSGGVHFAFDETDFEVIRSESSMGRGDKLIGIVMGILFLAVVSTTALVVLSDPSDEYQGTSVLGREMWEDEQEKNTLFYRVGRLIDWVASDSSMSSKEGYGGVNMAYEEFDLSVEGGGDLFEFSESSMQQLKNSAGLKFKLQNLYQTTHEAFLENK